MELEALMPAGSMFYEPECLILKVRDRWRKRGVPGLGGPAEMRS